MKVSYSKHNLIDRYYEQLPKIMNEEAKEIGNSIFSGIPEFLSNEE